MPPDSAEAWRWMNKAEQDRSAAHKLFVPGCLELSIVGFLCQQSVEKMLKALMISRGQEPDRTHNLRWLAERCVSLDPSVQPLIEPADSLTAYAVIHRYPGPDEPTHDQVRLALEVVEIVREQITRRIPAPPR